jgi:hypothetical protein
MQESMLYLLTECKGRCPELYPKFPKQDTDFRLGMFDLKRISRYKKEEVTGGWRTYILIRFMFYPLHQILLGRLNQG